MWEVVPTLQHSWRVLTMVQYTLLSSYQGQPAIMFGASFVLIPSHQVCTNLKDALSYLKRTTKDCVILVSTPGKLMYSPQPRRGEYLTLLPISGNPDIDQGPLHAFTATALSIASREGHGGDMPVYINGVDIGACPFQGPTMEKHLLCGAQSQWGIITGQTAKPLCQELAISLAGPGGKLEYTSTE